MILVMLWDTPDGVSDVYITSLTEYPEKEIAELLLHASKSLYHNILDNGKCCDQRYEL